MDKELIRRELRRWIKEGGARKDIEGKRRYRRLCEEKKREIEKWEREVKETKTERQV